MTSTAIREFNKRDTTIYWGDCIIALNEKVANESVNMIFADPPYNIGKKFGQFKDSWPSDEDYAAWCYKWLDVCIRKLTPSGTMYVMSSTQSGVM